MIDVIMGKVQAEYELEEFKGKLQKILEEFKQYYSVKDLKIEAYVKSYPMGYSIEADMYVDGEHCKHYSLADSLLLELNNLMLSRLAQLRSAE